MQATNRLYVDLDGTLVATDTLIELALQAVKQRPFQVISWPFWLLRGKAFFKQRLTAETVLLASLLPYRVELLTYIKERKESGTRIFLATASNEHLAQRVAEHVGLFDAVLASGATNLRSEAKREAILAHANGEPFEYIGNESIDLPIWQAATIAHQVGENRAFFHLPTTQRGKTFATHSFGQQCRFLIRALRPHQWAKNILVFLPALLAGSILEPGVFLQSIFAFVSFSLVASSVYLWNDLFDLNNDRGHEEKRTRPFAAGNISILWGVVASLTLLGGAIIIASLASTTTLTALLLGYVLANILYTFSVRRVAIVDVLFLAGFYVARIFAGSYATAIPVSNWLFGFVFFFFLSLALVKRFVELQKQTATQSFGRGYHPGDIELVRTTGLSAGLISVLILVLYTHLSETALTFAEPGYIWIAALFLVYWVLRMWLLAGRGVVTSDPLVFALRDRVSHLIAIGTLIFFFLAH